MMPIVLGVDLGTTKITCIAVDSNSGTIIANGSATNEANITTEEDRARGHSEWRADLILSAANQCLASVASQLGQHVNDVVGIGITGQQHGMVLVDSTSLKPISSLINWQDRRALQRIPNGESTWLEEARSAIGRDAWQRTGCWLHPGFMAVTLFELMSPLKSRLTSIPADRSLDSESIFCAMEQAILSAVRKQYGEDESIEVRVDRVSKHPVVTIGSAEIDSKSLGELLGRISAQSAKKAMLEEIQKRKMNNDRVRALFIMDYFAASLTGQPPVTEPSCAGSSGVYNVRTRNWDDEAIQSLGLSRSLFPEIHEASHKIGGLTFEQARSTGLPEGTPVFAPIGDHQASFLGSVADRPNSVLVNVGTGAQVAVFTDGFDFALPIELRPFPCGGNLLSNVGLAGGWSYQVLEQFFHETGRTLFQTDSREKLYETMTDLASKISPGADGLRCEPRFAGTRLDPSVRGSITGLSPQNFTAGHLARAVLEGMGRSLHEGFQAIYKVTGRSPTTLIAAGNGLRENPLLAEIVSQLFGLPMKFTRHREEAAFGAALVATVGSGLYGNLEAAAQRLIKTT